MVRRRFPSDQLVAKGGNIRAHVFENRDAGVSRGLFWAITVDFAPVRYAGRDWSCSMTCEWIPWAITDWHELDNKHLDVAYAEQGIESSFYMAEHDIGTHTRLWLARRAESVFNVRMEMTVDFKGYCGGDHDQGMLVAGEVDIPFTGVLVVPDNLEPRPMSIDEVKSVASGFIDLSCFRQPKRADRTYVFEPRIGVATTRQEDDAPA